MTEVLAPAEQVAGDRERDRVAWNLPRTPKAAESRRHDLKAITAYAAHKHSRAASLAQAADPMEAERIGATASVEAWEDEGGALQ